MGVAAILAWQGPRQKAEGRSTANPTKRFDSEAQRAKSIADFISKSRGALQELEETAYWLQLIRESGVSTHAEIEALSSGTGELITVFVTILKVAKRKKN